jgi:hypothetical protein
MCLRPCQAASTPEQYRGETGRVADFLSSRGDSLIRQLEAERDAASTALEFEAAAKIHRRLEKTRDALKLNEDLARDVDRLYGVVVQRAVDPRVVDLWFLCQGGIQPRVRLDLAPADGQPISLDRRLQEAILAAEFKRRPPRERAEHLALLVRWYASSWRAGELLLFEGLDRIPYRKLVRVISRVAAAQSRESRPSSETGTPFT